MICSYSELPVIVAVDFKMKVESLQMDLAFCSYGSRFCFRTNFLFAIKNDQNYDESRNPCYLT
jgi:hypothetical protein